MITSSLAETSIPVQSTQVTFAVYVVFSVGQTSKSGSLLMTAPVVLLTHSNVNVSAPVSVGAKRHASSEADHGESLVFLPGAEYPSTPFPF